MNLAWQRGFTIRNILENRKEKEVLENRIECLRKSSSSMRITIWEWWEWGIEIKSRNLKKIVNRRWNPYQEWNGIVKEACQDWGKN